MSLIDDSIDRAFISAIKTIGVVGKAAISLTGKIVSEVQTARKFHRAAKVSTQNRSVFIAPEINKNLLPLNDDPDYDDVQVKNLSWLDYIYPDGETLGNLIISGGTDKERSKAFIPFIMEAQKNNIPVIAIHNNNHELEKLLQRYSSEVQIISQGNRKLYFNIFGGLNTDNIVRLLIKSLDDEPEHGFDSLLRALIEFLLLRDGTISLHNMAAFSINDFTTELQTNYDDKLINKQEYDEIMNLYKAGSASRETLKRFLKDLCNEFEAVFGTFAVTTSAAASRKISLRKKSSVRKILNDKGIVILNAGSGIYEKCTDLMINYLLMLKMQGFAFNILIDNFPVYKFPKFRELLRDCNFSLGHKDFIASLSGGDEDLFNELTSGSTAVIFRHTGESSREWSEYLGTYQKIKSKTSIGHSGGIFNFSPSKSTEDEEDEKPRISPAAISRLPDSTACIMKYHEIFIANIL